MKVLYLVVPILGIP